MHKNNDPILIVGAGLAGLVAARELRGRGYKMIVLEQAPVVGGRMATRTVDGARFDSGAQFFTIRERRFQQMVEQWIADGVAVLWSRGFARASGRLREDGHPRYRGVPGMDSITSYLAKGLDVRPGKRVMAARPVESGWQLELAGGEEIEGRALLLTPPLPQSLQILRAGDYELPVSMKEGLEAVDYAPCLALLVELEDASAIPAPGGLQLHGEPLAFIGDNTRKGVSPDRFAVTIHGGPQFSKDYWDSDDETVVEQLLDAASFWLGAPVRSWILDRWRYSIPEETITERTVAIPGPAPLVFAGDVFGGPRVEGAVLSGLAAAEKLVG